MREQNNSKAYQNVFNEIQLSTEMKEELQNMAEKKVDKIKQMRRKKMKKYVAAAAAFIAVFFVASNGVVYAQTGSTWINKLSLYINGKEVELDHVVLEQGTNGEGENYYIVQVPENEEGDEESVEMELKDTVEP